MIALALFLGTLGAGRYEGALRGGPETMPIVVEVTEVDQVAEWLLARLASTKR
jgi:hypothetical protein